ncbi:16941_t:CDS:2, partial [Dentiscutata heterogama]
MKINSITNKYNYQNYNAIEEYYREETLYSEDESTYKVMETSLNQALEASFQDGQSKKNYPIDATRTNAMMITEKRGLTQLLQKGQICKVIKQNKKLGKAHITKENEIRRKNQNGWWTIYEIIEEEIEQLPNVSIMEQ